MRNVSATRPRLPPITLIPVLSQGNRGPERDQRTRNGGTHEPEDPVG